MPVADAASAIRAEYNLRTPDAIQIATALYKKANLFLTNDRSFLKINEIKVILLDEPIAGINPRLAHEIFEHILNLRKELNTTFLVVEHRLDVALRYVDKVYAMHRGRIIVEGGPNEVVSHPKVIESYLGG